MGIVRDGGQGGGCVVGERFIVQTIDKFNANDYMVLFIVLVIVLIIVFWQ